MKEKLTQAIDAVEDKKYSEFTDNIIPIVNDIFNNNPEYKRYNQEKMILNTSIEINKEINKDRQEAGINI